MSHIFISYNQSDADFAAVLSIHIEKAGVDTWMDKSRLRPGQDWSVEIDEAILNSHALVLVISPEAKASEYVTYEWSFALGAGVPVIPVLYKETALHPRLARVHYLKFTDTTVRPWEKLIETVQEAVSSSGVYAVRIPRDAPPHVKSAVISLDSANDADRDGAIRVLAQTDHPSAREALSAALTHPLRSVRWAAALRVSEDDRAVPVLLDAFLSAGGDDDPLAYQPYAQHLADFGPAGMEALLGILKGDVGTGYVQRWLTAAEFLGKFSEGEAVPSLLQLLHGADPVHRRRAALALGYHKSDLVEDELLGALNDEDEQVRAKVIWSFHRLAQSAGSDKCWNGFLAGLKDSKLSVRTEVAHSDARWYLREGDPPEFFKKELIKMTNGEPLVNALAVYRLLLTGLLRDTELVELGVVKDANISGIPSECVVLARREHRWISYYISLDSGFPFNTLIKVTEEDERAVAGEKKEGADLKGTVEWWVTNLVIDPASLESEKLQLLT